MEFYHLRSFIVVAETKNLTLAAKHLCTTPPAISAHIKTLEEELKTELFTRSSKGMALTEKGALLLDKAQKTLASANDMVNLAVQNQDELIGDLSLSINQDSHALLISQLLQNIHENCPGISLQIESANTGQCLSKISNQELDGGYIYGAISDDYFSLKIKEQPMTVIVHPESKLNQDSTKLELKNAPWISVSNNCPFDQLLESSLGVDINQVVKVDDDNCRLTLVKEKLGLSFIEHEVGKENVDNNLVKLLPQLNTTLALNFVVKKSRINEPIIKALLQEIRILWDLKL